MGAMCVVGSVCAVSLVQMLKSHLLRPWDQSLAGRCKCGVGEKAQEHWRYKLGPSPMKYVFSKVCPSVGRHTKAAVETREWKMCSCLVGNTWTIIVLHNENGSYLTVSIISSTLNKLRAVLKYVFKCKL